MGAGAPPPATCLREATDRYGAARAELQAGADPDKAEMLNQMDNIENNLIGLRDRSLHHWQVMC